MDVKVLVVVGPTGVGKTKVSIELAKRLNGEIISGDSVQVYKHLDVGSAKVTPDEMEGVVHHLIDYLELDETYSVADFQREVRTKIHEIVARGKLPIICGGTGLYIKAALHNYEFHSEARDIKRVTQYESFSNEELYNKLTEVDPLSAKKFHPNNRVRVLRALEYYSQMKQPISTVNQSHEEVYENFIIGLTMDRERLYERINLRVDKMLQKGLLEEVERLYPMKEHIEGIGYNELFSYKDGVLDLDEAIEKIKQNSRRYAKRQYTWFNNQMATHWIDVEEKLVETTVDEIVSLLKEEKFI